MYNDKLSNIFNIAHQNKYHNQPVDKLGYPWGFNAKNKSNSRKKKIFYAIGDSWLDSVYFNRVFLNDYPDYFFINRSLRGASNTIMLNLLKEDIELLKLLNIDLVFLVAFSEVGRSLMDFHNCTPKNYSSTHSYLGSILKEQHEIAKTIVGEYPNYITTAFISNNFNDNQSILDFCSKNKLQKPQDVFTVYSNGIFKYFKDRSKIFKFDFVNDLDKSLELKNFMESNSDIDDSLHPYCYKVYEDFLEHVFSNLNIK